VASSIVVIVIEISSAGQPPQGMRLQTFITALANDNAGLPQNCHMTVHDSSDDEM
jgi:hypothetical protein